MKKHTGYQVKHHTANHKKYRKLSKTAAVVGSTVTAVSVAAPLMPAVNVQADTVQYSSASSQQQFINQIAPHAQSVANANDLYASVMMAQAILESAWGQSTLAQAPNYNLFGIKGSYNGQTVYMNTLEFLNGQWVTKNEPFRRYPSFAESFMDNARTLRTVSFQSGVYYYAGAWKSNTTSYRDATAWLTGRYATDPNYATSLNRIIETYGLTRYDTASNGTPSTVIGGGISSENNAGVVNNPSQSTGNLGGSTYTVSVGDTLWAISRKFGVTITQLKSWNNLSSDMIYVGQKLSIQTGTGNTAVTPTPSTPGVSNNPTTSNAQTYTVVAGDSVWKIAHQFGISMDTLRSLNNIQNNFIYPGQVLKIRLISSSNGTTTVPTPTTPSIPSQNQSTNTGSNQTASVGNYTVKAGDSLWSIANKHGLSVAQLKSMNGLSSDMIYAGQKLTVKTGASSTSSTTSSANTNTGATTNPVTNTQTSNASSYTVKSGDSLWSIANRHGLSVSQLKNMNGLTSDIIYPGQTLKVGQGNNTSTTAPSKIATTTPAPSQVSTTSSNTSTSTSKTYTVASGDSLWAIANKHGLSVSQLKNMNGLTSDIIYPGQTLKVGQGNNTSTTAPSKIATTTPAPSQVSTTSSNTSTSTSKTYTVASGDSLWAIANKHGLSVSQLKNMNGLTSDIIYPGQTLKVGQGNNTSTTAPSKIATTTPAPSQVSTTSSNTSTSTSKTYTVASGDSLWAIANKHGLSVSQLKNMNGLTSDVIYPGKQLLVSQTSNSSATVNLISLNTTNTNSSSNNLNRAAIVAEANKHIGKPYAWGAKGPDSFDCSGYTRYVFLQVTGRDIGSNTVAQEKAGTIISVDQAKAGDLYFWGSQGSSYHVAIALGNGSYIYASEPGDFVKIGSVANFAPDFAVRM
ncbi:C40 family peptidase [Enterococcus cecorum]|uniref:C40 family peptidase n=2 Tax=Enterococcus cecorum TaxID=44008 RepID=UPI002ACA98D7|nr:LysM peptidoglycan-binding domain-containing protein [Enterococcus cecorum]MDZ5580287.1 LysM peptidoglycan-binding domain-containing protein [Enterococcus cecorum]MDZ5589624.1 LysM peptidoglycan-binding domain-containing protein [Enterococcus cecorum]MDZ5600119.1 LysM peptidoglycan-binding domain-containing protein [Enterococcus cecorum]